MNINISIDSTERVCEAEHFILNAHLQADGAPSDEDCEDDYDCDEDDCEDDFDDEDDCDDEFEDEDDCEDDK